MLIYGASFKQLIKSNLMICCSVPRMKCNSSEVSTLTYVSDKEVFKTRTEPHERFKYWQPQHLKCISCKHTCKEFRREAQAQCGLT